MTSLDADDLDDVVTRDGRPSIQQRDLLDVTGRNHPDVRLLVEEDEGPEQTQSVTFAPKLVDCSSEPRRHHRRRRVVELRDVALGMPSAPGRPGARSGLGEVSQVYVYPLVSPPAAECRANGGFNVADYAARLIVKGKGEIFLAVKGTDACLFGPPSDTVVNTTLPFTVIGGSGAYVGASGSGTVTEAGHFSPSYGHAVGRDTWTGTLLVPGLAFDLTPPTLDGAPSKTVRVRKRVRQARVTYSLRAQDDVDGAVPVSCKPRSGSRFKVGRTVVRCSATDSSGNAAAATFTVTVKRRR